MTIMDAILEHPPFRLDLGCGPRKREGFYGIDAMKFDGWHRLHREYAAQFGVKAADLPAWGGDES